MREFDGVQSIIALDSEIWNDQFRNFKPSLRREGLTTAYQTAYRHTKGFADGTSMSDVCGAGAHGAAGGISLLSCGERLACGNRYGRVAGLGPPHKGNPAPKEHRPPPVHGNQ